MDLDKTIMFLVSWAVNSVCILVMSAILPSAIGLGNTQIPGPMVAVFAALVFTLVIAAVVSYIKNKNLHIKDERLGLFVPVIPLVPIIWLYKSAAFITAFGISHNFFAIVLAIILTVAQYFAYKYTSIYLKKI